ncbi:MAG: sigma 54-interacting transcriptional regulator [Candidatus Hydrogenedentes bacterium]|nr:sigma 54-interacting transcriptional regulator [Candidatus Hydrogenedentota bacterium]
MSLLSPEERRTLIALSRLAYANPFLPERIALEREVLEEAFVWTDAAWHRRIDMDGQPPNIDLLTRKVSGLIAKLRRRWLAGERVSDREARLYEDAVLFYLYNRHHPSFNELLHEVDGAGRYPRCEAPFYREFLQDLEHYFGLPPVPSVSSSATFVSLEESVHLFACFYQLRRAFHFIHGNILGGSMSAARFRASVWESIFTRDMRRYQRSLYNRMEDIATLITGPSGTGKELVAQAIGYAPYIPFDPSRLRFVKDYRASYHPLNLAAFSPTLIESELFGHKKGAYTGALEDRLGWFEVCGPHGSVFLDEVGDIDPAIQVKLLRIIQNRTFQRIGDTATYIFEGKLVSATSRDLAADMRAGRFREDLYYRLCSDIIETPSLRDQIRETPEHLHHLILYIAQRVGGEEEYESLAHEAETWIHEHLGDDYPWDGNVRELEQCVRNIMVRQSYRPPSVRAATAREELAAAVVDARLTSDELLRHYFTLVYGETRNYSEAARRLDVDARTVKGHVDHSLLERYGLGAPSG